MNNTVTLHRVVRASTEKVFRAFSDPLAYASWIAPHGFYGKVHAFDFRVGGKCSMSFVNFTSQQEQFFGGTFLEIIANEKIVFDEQFDGDDLPGTMLNTITLQPAICGTNLQIVQSNIPVAIPVDICCLGWQESLSNLMNLVEPVIPEG